MARIDHGIDADHPGHPDLRPEHHTDPDRDTPGLEVAPDERVATRCPYCGRPFPRERLRTLHVGEAHPERYSEAEREAYETARDEESGELFVYHVKVVFALSIIYTLFVLAYMVVLTYGL